MPGLIGYVGSTISNQTNEQSLARMARALEPENRFHTETYEREGFGLGRVTLGLVNGEPQPLWNEDQSMCIFMEGELFDYDDLKQDLLNRGHRFRINNDAEFALHLFEEFGDDFVTRLNGIFSLSIWDEKERRLILANDRLGLHPLYYAHHEGRLTYGSGVRALLADSVLPRRVDPVGIAQFLTFDHLLGDRTLVCEARLLPPASLLAYQDGRLTVRPYWAPRHPLTYELRKEEEWMEELLFVLRRAIGRQAKDDLPAGLLLSGGLDSRVLLAMLREGPYRNKAIQTFTWGIPGCDDARYAKEVAVKLGSSHHFYELKPDWLLGLAEECVRITDGMGNLVNLHARATLDEEAKHAQVLYKGFLGDAMFGFALTHKFWADYDDETRIRVHLQVHDDMNVITFKPWDHATTFTEAFQQQIGDAVLDSYRAGMDESGSTLLADQRIYFDYRQRVPRHTLNGVQAVRSRAVVRLPFMDKDLVEFALTVPPGMRLGRRVMHDAFTRAYPELAKIPIPNTGLPMVDCLRSLRGRAAQWLRWHLHAFGVPGIAASSKRPYKDYSNWFRTVLRDWIEDTLLDDRTLQRGYIRPDLIRNLVAEHMAGSEHTMKLGALMSLELWHRQYIDRPAA
jgi:asparagine synthase (glutamine-hydrolysing)